eukprot:157477_1
MAHMLSANAKFSLGMKPRKSNRNISIRERLIIIEQHKDQIPHEVIALDHQLAISTIKTYVRKYKKNGHVLTEFELMKMSGPIERQKLIEYPEIATNILTLNNAHPSAPLRAYSELIYGDYHIYIPQCTVGRFFTRIKYKWKRISPIAKESNEVEQLHFWRAVNTIMTSAEQGIWIYESHRSDKTVNILHGRGPPGMVFDEINFSHGGYKLTVIDAVWVLGVLVYEIMFGACNEALFCEFMIGKLTPNLNIYPGPCSIMFLDNVQFHHTPVLLELVDDIGCVVVWLARYCPKDNLAEISFKDAKLIEREKGIVGEREALVSLARTFDYLKTKNYRSCIERLGYPV